MSSAIGAERQGPGRLLLPDSAAIGLVRLDEVVFHSHDFRRDLGDLRALTESIYRYGVMQPVVVEHWGHQLRLRAGHRRVVAARLAGLQRIPAIIHAEALESEDWLVASIQENEQRLQLQQSERIRAVRALLELGCSRQGIADTFGVSESTIRSWLTDRTSRRDPAAEGRRNHVRLSAGKVRRMVQDWRTREASAQVILDELEHLFAVKDT